MQTAFGPPAYFLQVILFEDNYCQLNQNAHLIFVFFTFFYIFCLKDWPERKMYSQIIAGKNVMTLGQPAQFFTTIVVLLIYCLQYTLQKLPYFAILINLALPKLETKRSIMV